METLFPMVSSCPPDKSPLGIVLVTNELDQLFLGAEIKRVQFQCTKDPKLQRNGWAKEVAWLLPLAKTFMISLIVKAWLK